jgi:hypothetical protein
MVAAVHETSTGIIDINLGRVRVSRSQVLVARDIPFIFVTGWGREHRRSFRRHAGDQEASAAASPAKSSCKLREEPPHSARWCPPARAASALAR